MKKTIFFFLLMSISLIGCLEDNIIIPDTKPVESSAGLLTYLERDGDFINTLGFPPIVKGEDIYDAIQFENALVLDIRSEEEYAGGHIEKSININYTGLLNYFDNNPNWGTYSKIVIVSQFGQRAAYYASLLRLYGFENIYSLNYGMAGWHQDFASEMLAALNNDNAYNAASNNINEVPTDYYKLPEIELSEEGSLEDKLKSRVAELLQEDFIVDSELPGELTISKLDLLSEFDQNKVSFPGYYIMCYSIEDLYFVGSRGCLDCPGHLASAVLYRPTNGAISDLKSTTLLQTIPTDKEVIIYSYSGQYSAYAAAYLRLLGYNVKSLLFGTNNLFYNRMMSSPTLNPYAYKLSEVPDLPYVTGN